MGLSVSNAGTMSIIKDDSGFTVAAANACMINLQQPVLCFINVSSDYCAPLKWPLPLVFEIREG